MRQAAADLEEEAELQYIASRDRVWASLKLLSDVRPDRASQRDAVIAELAAVDPKVCPSPGTHTATPTPVVVARGLACVVNVTHWCVRVPQGAKFLTDLLGRAAAATDDAASAAIAADLAELAFKGESAQLPAVLTAVKAHGAKLKLA